MRGRRGAVALALLAALAVAGCSAARSAYRKGNREAERGNWDMAVARYTLATENDPGNIGYRIALQTARIEASRAHYAEAKQYLASQELAKARDELEIAVKYDSGNQAAEDELIALKERIAAAEAEKEDREAFEEKRRRAAARVPLPVLSPRSQDPINLKFTDQSLEKIFEALSKLTGVNILLDPDFRDQTVSVALSGVTFEEALEQITFVNKLFYKVLNQSTIIIVPETAQKRRTYDENLVQTFYLQNSDVNEMVALLTKLTGIQKTAGNEVLKAITVMGTPDELALAERIIATNDKARGEVMIEVEFLEVNLAATKRWGIELSNYELGATFSPTGADGEVTEGGFTNVRAHLLSSINLSDFIVSVPASIFTRFLQDGSNVRILASPKLRAAEGQQTSLRIGTEVPIPVTTFTATQAGSTTFAPATSFQYRNVGATLEITPSVTSSGEITLEMLVEFSLLGDDRNVGTGANPLVVPTFLTRNVTGTLRLRDGERALLGGLIQETEAETLRGALGLQSIPILGGLFRSNQKRTEKQEILVSITPHIVRAPRVTEDDLGSLYAGTRERVIVPGARPPLFGPEEEEPLAEPTPPPGEAGPAPAEEPGAASQRGAPEELAGGETTAPPEGPVVPPVSVPPAATPTPYPEPPAPDSEPTSPARALFRPGELSLTPGQSREVDLVVLSAEEFNQAELVLAFDAERMAIESVSPGALLTLSGEAVGVEMGQEEGRVRVTFRHPGGTSGSGAIARVRVRGLVPGSGILLVDSLVLTSAEGERQEIPASAGRVVVIGSP